MIIKHNQRSLRRKFCRKCGSQVYYWGHDTEAAGRPGSRFCAEHGSQSWVLLNADDSPHICGGELATATGEDDDGAIEANPVESSPAPVIQATVTDVPAPAATVGNADLMAALGPFAAMLAPALAPLIGAKVDESQVRDIVNGMLAGRATPLQLEIKRDGEIHQIEGNVHAITPLVIRRLNRGRNVMMVGPAGTGKSTIAAQAAEALGLKHYEISLTPQTPASSIMGYMTATGDYVRSLFREAFENGGVFHFDEIDNSHPSTLAIINAAAAAKPGREIGFPDGMVKRHADFRLVASANTYGRGPDRAYVGRQAIDAATLDRFSVLTVEVDESLEEAMCMGTGLDSTRVKRVLAYVRHLRNKAAEYKMPLVFSPRRAEGMCDALADGMAVAEALETEVKRGITETDWNKVSNGAPSLG